MATITFEELGKKIAQMSDEQKQHPARVYSFDPVIGAEILVGIADIDVKLKSSECPVVMKIDAEEGGIMSYREATTGKKN